MSRRGIGVESTARAAFDYGYNVLLVRDAMTDRDADAHRHSVEKIFPKLGQVATAEEGVGFAQGFELKPRIDRLFPRLKPAKGKFESLSRNSSRFVR